VKNGNIIIGNAVTKLAGAFVTLNGTIQSNGISTINRLTLDGSLYGNIDDLVQHRTYLYGRTNYSVLDTGIIIRYSPRIFERTPPLLSDFIEAFRVQKIAQ
jgi:hypothetical protein